MCKASRIVGMLALFGVAMLLAGRAGMAGILEVTASDATPAAIAAAGFGNNLNGQGIQVGVAEAGNAKTNTGNAFLPNTMLVVPAQNAGQAALVITNHATEVTGQIVATPASG